MGIDQNEARRQRTLDKPKYNSDPNKPYAAIPHRVIESAAFADLTPSAIQVLVLIVRQLTGDKTGKVKNNGDLHAAWSYMKKYGVGSDRTVTRAIHELIGHGFLFRAKAGGYGVGVARYAVTWHQLTKGRNASERAAWTHWEFFKPDAWHLWEPNKAVPERGARNPKPKKLNPTKVRDAYRKNGGRQGGATDKNADRHPDKSADDVFNTNTQCKDASPTPNKTTTTTANGSEPDRLSAYLAKLNEARLGSGQHATRVRAHLTLIEGRAAA